MDFKRLDREFFERSALVVAKELLGKTLVMETESGLVAGKIVETEAYLNDDPASHSFRGKTPRNVSMFKKAGTAYVYVSYGIHHCMNIVTGEESVGEAVLLRAIEPLEGIEFMMENRKKTDLKDLSSGPGKLTQAFGISLKEDGADMCFLDSKMWVAEGVDLNESLVVKTKRVGISKAEEKPYRFYIKDNKFISRK